MGLMSSREILQLGHPMLWTKAGPVGDVRSSGTQSLIQDLAETLASFREKSGYGRGIAAPQIGVSQRVIFIRMQPDGFSGALIHPEIVWRSPDQFELWDDCFSFPELLVRVRRAREIRVRYLDDEGVGQSLSAAGDFSELLQHEIDHLDGVLAVDRAVGPQAFATRAEWERRYRGR
jgi:peptide deformylase